MTFPEFRTSIAAAQPPAGLSDALQSLWWDAKGDWDRAHHCAQRDEGHSGSSVHAYLHRKEGDLSNARWWYRRAGSSMPNGPLQAEWEALAHALLG